MLFVLSAVSQHLGAAIAVLLFAAVPALGVAWLRVVAAAAVMAVWRRPWRRRWSGIGTAAPQLVIAFGLVLAAMNLAFYLAIERLPLGTVVAVEFLGPIVVAAVGSRTRSDLVAFVLALAGVGLLSDAQLRVGGTGLVFAFAAAALWALYIVLGSRVAAGGRGVDALAVGMLAGATVITPVAAPSALPALVDPLLLAACLGVGILSSVVPYGLEQRVLTHMGPGAFALLLSLSPATAAVIGLLVLRQVPSVGETAGIALVAVAVAIRGSR